MMKIRYIPFGYKYENGQKVINEKESVAVIEIGIYSILLSVKSFAIAITPSLLRYLVNISITATDSFSFITF